MRKCKCWRMPLSECNSLSTRQIASMQALPAAPAVITLWWWIKPVSPPFHWTTNWQCCVQAGALMGIKPTCSSVDGMPMPVAILRQAALLQIFTICMAPTRLRQWQTLSGTMERLHPFLSKTQPQYRGTVFARAALETVKTLLNEFDFKLLVHNFALNDFGDTHSLLLIVDSLALQNTFARLDDSLTTATMDAIFQAASKRTAVSSLGKQGQAEGDVLENVIKSLGRMFGVSLDPMAANLQGGTWANPADREIVHRNLKKIT